MLGLVDAIALGGFGYVLWRGQMREQVWRARVGFRKLRVRNFPTTPIVESRPGTVVKIVGYVEAVGELAEAPLTADSAVASLTTVDIFSPKATAWYVRDERVSDFIVRDATGSALIRGRRACIVTDPRAVAAPDADRKSRWMRRWRVRDRFLGFARTLVFSEATLVPGTCATVLGTCVERRGGGDAPYREQAEVAITIDAPERGRVIVDW